MNKASAAVLLTVKLPVDVRALGIGDLATDQPDDIAVLEIGRMSIAKDNVARRCGAPENRICTSVAICAVSGAFLPVGLARVVTQLR